MPNPEAIAVVAGWSVLLFTALWLVQQVRRDATVVDVGWAFGLVGAAGLIAWLGDGHPGRRALLGGLGGLWALRLGSHLLRDRVWGRREEDGRYRRMRAAMGRWASVGFFLFFLLQAGFVVLFSLPWLAVARHPDPPGVLAAVAVGWWLVAIGGEWLADRQLARFRSDPAQRGRTCRAGLWRYSRHPNYFFEWLHWFTYPLLAFGGPAWGWSLLGPGLMLVFLLWVTGIPHSERQALSHRPDYAAYRAETPAFIPWFPRRPSG